MLSGKALGHQSTSIPCMLNSARYWSLTHLASYPDSYLVRVRGYNPSRCLSMKSILYQRGIQILSLHPCGFTFRRLDCTGYRQLITNRDIQKWMHILRRPLIDLKEETVYLVPFLLQLCMSLITLVISAKITLHKRNAATQQRTVTC